MKEENGIKNRSSSSRRRI